MHRLRLLKFSYIIYFFALALFVLAPVLFSKGYILNLDMIFTPGMNHHNFEDALINMEIRRIFFFYLVKIIPSFILQRLILLFTLFGTSYFMYLFLRKVGKVKENLSFPALTAATLYLINPFVYTRLLAGHWLFLIGYAFLPLFLYYFLKDKRIHAILTWGIISILSPHHLILYFLALVAFIPFTKKKVKALYVIIPTLLVSLVWIIPSLFRNPINKFSTSDLNFYASNPDKVYGLSYNLLNLKGFWAENTLNYSEGLIPLTFVLLLILILLVLFLARKPKKEYGLIISTLTVGFLGLFLAHGSYELGKPVWDLFYSKLYILKPFREPQKFLSLYSLMLSILLFFSAKNWSKYSALILVPIFLASSSMFLGLSGQLKSVDYPDSWYYLEEQGDDQKILVLPWVEYAHFPFAGKQIMDPSPSFFSAELISNQSINTTEYDLSERKLRQEGIDYVLLNKVADYKSYLEIENWENVEKEYEDENGIVFSL